MAVNIVKSLEVVYIYEKDTEEGTKSFLLLKADEEFFLYIISVCQAGNVWVWLFGYCVYQNKRRKDYMLLQMRNRHALSGRQAMRH